jgi:hypothetical protein
MQKKSPTAALVTATAAAAKAAGITGTATVAVKAATGSFPKRAKLASISTRGTVAPEL